MKNRSRVTGSTEKFSGRLRLSHDDARPGPYSSLINIFRCNLSASNYLYRTVMEPQITRSVRFTRQAIGSLAYHPPPIKRAAPENERSEPSGCRSLLVTRPASQRYGFCFVSYWFCSGLPEEVGN